MSIKEPKMKQSESMPGVLPARLEFFPERVNLLLTVDSQEIDSKLKSEEAERLGLLKKNDFHLTVIGSATGDEILKSLSGLTESERAGKLEEIRLLSESIRWQVKLKSEFFYLQKDYNDPSPDDPEVTIPEKRESIIQMAVINGLEEFYQRLNQLLSQQFEVPLPHITLSRTFQNTPWSCQRDEWVC